MRFAGILTTGKGVYCLKRLKLGSSAVYRICVQGTLDQDCRDQLQDMMVLYEYDKSGHPVTILTSHLMDQAVLLGVLTTLYNIYRLPLLSVERISTRGK